jgi:hypothetical protein
LGRAVVPGKYDQLDPLTSVIFACASSIVNEPGFCARELLERLHELGHHGLGGKDEIGVVQYPVVVRVRRNSPADPQPRTS